MKYREDMMENLEKGSGMHSDRPRITTNGLPLEGSSHVLERERRELLLEVVGLVGGEERDIPYKSSLATPPVLRRRGLSAIPWRTVRHYNLRLSSPLKLPLINFSLH